MTLHDTGTGCFAGEFVGFPKNGSHFQTYPPVFMFVKSMITSDHPTVGGSPIFGDPHTDRVEAAPAGQPTRSAGAQRGSAGVDGGERGVVQQGMACGLIYPLVMSK